MPTFPLEDASRGEPAQQIGFDERGLDGVQGRGGASGRASSRARFAELVPA